MTTTPRADVLVARTRIRRRSGSTIPRPGAGRSRALPGSARSPACRSPTRCRPCRSRRTYSPGTGATRSLVYRNTPAHGRVVTLLETGAGNVAHVLAQRHRGARHDPLHPGGGPGRPADDPRRGDRARAVVGQAVHGGQLRRARAARAHPPAACDGQAPRAAGSSSPGTGSPPPTDTSCAPCSPTAARSCCWCRTREHAVSVLRGDRRRRRHGHGRRAGRVQPSRSDRRP